MIIINMHIHTHPRQRLTGLAWLLATALLNMAPALAEQTQPCGREVEEGSQRRETGCGIIEEVTIFGSANEVRDIAGGANLVSSEDLAQFASTDVVRAIRRVPGVSLQVEDGYGLRPNISIRGTATERSSRVTLMEDNVLIAPATYSAPAAYYFPTFGRIHSVEVLKGPAAITEGPYTVGGAINLISTPIPERRAGRLVGEYGSDMTWRTHGWYGDGGDHAGFLVETHHWQSDGYQRIDRDASTTGLDKQDYLAKFRFTPETPGTARHILEIKLQSSKERSRQSYLGLTDADFTRDALRRYGASARDVMDNEHAQFTATWRIESDDGPSFALTAYHNDFERAWYKTEGLDLDGSADPRSFQRTSWSNVIQAINGGQSLGTLPPEQLAALLAGADTAPGSIQLRNNARTYFSQGLQTSVDHRFATGSVAHALQAGLRLHRDEEDRLQRNDNFQQIGGALVLNARGLEGNAGNRVQDAEAWAVYVHDRIEWRQWTLTPGLRYESIDLARFDYDTSADDPARRDPGNLTGTRRNQVDVWIPGAGLLYDFDDRLRLVAGAHRGFSTPGNQPGVEPEESVNYELGIRYQGYAMRLDVLGFFNDYANLVGTCTNASGGGCEPGDSFNGDGVHVPGLEVNLEADLNPGRDWEVPLRLSYTWMDATFRTGFDSEFFGEVSKGDPVPYIPRHQAWASIGVVKERFAGHLSVNHVDSVCTRARCGSLERTESATLFDLALHYRLNADWEIYAVAENLTDELYIAGREPYGARPNKPRSLVLGTRFDF